MDTITIENIFLFGIHGAERYEHRAPQEFKITITLSQWERNYDDTLEKTYDYKQAIEIARKIIRGPRITLIETLAENIAREILVSDNRLYCAEVTLVKPRALSVGVPSVTAIRYAECFKGYFLPFNIEEIIQTLKDKGGISVPLIPEEYRMKLLTEAKNLTYIDRPKVVGKGLVHEELEAAEQFPDESALVDFKEKFEEVLWWKFTQTLHLPFREPLHFNEMRVQHYRPGSIGITPHRDGASYHNLIAVLILEGNATFALTKNRTGDDPHLLDATPGNIILMRAPGFLGSSYRPFHTVSNIEEDRYILGIGQKITH